MSLTESIDPNEGIYEREEEVIWCLMIADILELLDEMKEDGTIKEVPNLTEEQIRTIRKGVEAGLGECWHPILWTAIETALDV